MTQTFKTLARSLAVSAGLVLAVLPGAVCAQAQEAGDKVVARVNGTAITEKDVALAQAEIGDRLQRIPQNARRRVLIEFLIENQLIAEAAVGKGIETSDDFKDRLAYWKRRSLREAYFENVVSGSISEAEMRKFYDEKIKPQSSGEEIRASHILVKTKEKAVEIYEMLVHDGDFAELAKKNSQDPGSRNNGGDLGYFSKGMMVPAFEKAAFALKDDEISEPVQSRFGWHIIKLVDRREKSAPPFETVKPRLRMFMIRERVKTVTDDLRGKAQLEYLDPEVKQQVEGATQPKN